MKLTKRQILGLYNGLSDVLKLSGLKFAYAISRNLAKVTPVVKSVYKDDGFGPKASKKEREALEKKLDEEVEIDLYKIPVKYCPENITGKQMGGIMLIINEDLTN